MEASRRDLSNAASSVSLRPSVFEIAGGAGSDPPPPGCGGYRNSPGGGGLNDEVNRIMEYRDNSKIRTVGLISNPHSSFHCACPTIPGKHRKLAILAKQIQIKIVSHRFHFALHAHPETSHCIHFLSFTLFEISQVASDSFLRQLIQFAVGQQGQYFSLTLAVLRPYRRLYEVGGWISGRLSSISACWTSQDREIYRADHWYSDAWVPERTIRNESCASPARCGPAAAAGVGGNRRRAVTATVRRTRIHEQKKIQGFVRIHSIDA